MRFVPPTIKITVRRYRMSSEDIEKKGIGAEESNRMYESKGAAGQPENREADNTAGADNPSEEDKEAETGEIARKAQEIKDRAMQIQKMKAVRNVITFLAVVISAVLQAFVIQAFIRPAELLSGGFTGIAILVENADLYMGNKLSHITRNAVH